MSLWRDAATVFAGAAVTVVIGGLVLLSLPVLGFVTAHVVGNWVPIQVFALLLPLPPIGGGATTGFFQRTSRTKCVLLGGTAATLGILLVSVVVGLLALVVVLGMTPDGGGQPDYPRALFVIESLSGGVALLVGPVFGSIGGIGGYVGRRSLDARRENRF